MSKHDLPGVSLAMAHRGRLKLAACFGWADREQERPLRPRHRFRVASVSKPLTACVVLRLVEDGRLSLNDPVFGPQGRLADYYSLSDHPDAANRDRLQRVTVQHLLEHSAGGWGNRQADPMFVPEARGLDHRGLIRWTLEHQPLRRDPGAEFEYSNFGYCLLGRVIEQVTGQPYADVMRELLFAPAGAASLEVGGNTREERLPQEVAYYGQGEDPYGPAMNVRRMDAHGGWVATPIDLVRIALRADGFETPEDRLAAETLRRATRPSATGRTYGLGWYVNEAQNYWHTGSFNGGSAMLAWIHDHYCWAVAVNTRSKHPDYRADLDRFPWSVRETLPEWGDHDLFPQFS
jgi:CubicO group peptidase (beta-lactamase class C family)